MGSSSEIDLSLRGLYSAGRVVLPDKADDCVDAARSLAMALDMLDTQAARCGNPQPLVDAMSVCRDVYEGLQLAARNLNYGAVGLIHIADDFRDKDTLAADALNKLKDQLVPDIYDPVTGGLQPDPTPATPEEDLGTRNDSVTEPALPQAIEEAS